MHWTLGRAVLALAIANIFIGFYLSNIAHRHIIAQAVVLGGLFIMYMLKNDIEYLLIRKSPAEEERLLLAAQQPGMLFMFILCETPSLVSLCICGSGPAVVIYAVQMQLLVDLTLLLLNWLATLHK